MDIAALYFFILLFFFLSWFFIVFAVYFIPVVIAYIRKHNNLFAITVMTVFAGWTFFGWLAALLWALNSDTQDSDEE